jgi:catabolite regulation protein CreA
MKKVLLVIMSIILLLSITACGNNKDVTHVGVNAEILEVSKHVKGIVVKGLDDNSILGEKCYINCESSDVYFVYADNISGKTTDLQFEGLVVGDKITVDVKSVENKYALTSRVQLITQRK